MGDVDTSAGAAEARWRNYQHLIWTQQQIQLQIQQQNQQQNQQQPQHHHHHHSQQQQQQQQQSPNVKMEMDPQGGGMSNLTNGSDGGGHQQPQSLPMPEEKSPPQEKSGKGEGMDPWDNFDAQAAFLGPTLWDKRLPYDGQDFKLEYVDLEEFLTENGIPVERQQHAATHNGHPPGNGGGSTGGGSSSAISSSSSSSSINGMTPGDQINTSGEDCSPPPRGGGGLHPQQLQQPPQQQQATSHIVGQYGPGPSVRSNQGHNNHNGHLITHASLSNQQNLMRGPPSIHAQSEQSRSPSPCGSSISRSSDDSTSTLNSHHRGHDFDPRTRIFTEDELKPQPMIKKSKKQFVPDEQKDAKYWARRRKNNMAAKRSRDARRVKENQIAMRACFLEKENSILKQEIDRVQKENMMLKEQLNCCRHDH